MSAPIPLQPATPMAMPTAPSAGPRHPVVELLARYAAIFKAAWAARDQLAGPKRLADELAFMPAAMALQETPPHPAPRRAAIAICALFVIALAWACLGRLDIVAVAQGRIQVSDGAKLIQPLEASVVKAIHVHDGDKVLAGQLLLELDAALSDAEVARVLDERQAIGSELLRTAALIDSLQRGKVTPALRSTHDLSAAMHGSATQQLASEWSDIAAKLAKLAAEGLRRQAELHTVEQQISKLQTTLPLVSQREQDFKSLTAQGFISQHAGQDRTLERVSQEQDLSTLQARRSEALAAITEGAESAKAYRTETLRNLQDRLAQAELKSKQLVEASVKAKQRQGLTRLVAPVDGTVQQLAVHTAGGVVTPAQTLMVIVPLAAEVSAEVVLENKDVGFVQPGQLAEIKLETFPYSSYGTVPARVKSVSADAVMDEKLGAVFLAKLSLDVNHIEINGKSIKLAPGMNLTAELKTGRRTVIDYLLRPVLERTSESLKER